MEQSRGFTLVEVLGVIVVIVAISLLAFPPIIEQVRKSHSSVSDATKELIYAGADLYISSDNASYYKSSGNTYCIPLRSIVDKGFLNDPIKDTMTNVTLDLDDNVVKAVYGNKSFQYTLVNDGSCVEHKAVITFTEKMTGNSEVASLDPDGNLRYVGADPDNYVQFNGELWRIIGVFDGQIKIIRDEYYSTSIQWDALYNDWAEADLQETLNGTYLTSIQTNDPTSYSYIDLTHVWNIGAVLSDTGTWTRANVYSLERGSTPAGASGSKTTWTGAIGLMYPSDYGYSTSGAASTCDTTMADWLNNHSICYGNSWLHEYDRSDIQLTLTPFSDNTDFVLTVYPNGFVGPRYVYGSYAARPVLYLKSDVGIKSGTGDHDDPFILDWINE